MIHVLSMDKTTTLNEDNDSSFMKYTELGWEISVGRLKVIRMMQEGLLTKNDTIITLADRAFLYSKFCNTKPYTQDIIPVNGGLSPLNYGDWCQQIHCEGKVQAPWRWPQDIKYILDYDFEPVDPAPCVVINHRVRNWSTERNCNENTTRNFISMILSLGLKPFISGRYADKVDPRAEYIPSLRKVASIIHHPNCKAFIASGGPSLMAQQCCKNKLIFMNTCGCIGLNPLYLQDKMNFSKCQMHIINPDDVSGAKSIISS